MNNSPHACLRHTSKFHPQASFSHCKVAKFCINEFLRLNRIPTHRECNCEEFCLQTRPDWDVTKTGNGKMRTKPNLNPGPISKFISNSLFFILLFPVLVTSGQAPVVQTSDSAIQRINLYPVDSAIGFHNTYRLDSDLSGR